MRVTDAIAASLVQPRHVVVLPHTTLTTRPLTEGRMVRHIWAFARR